MYLEIYNLLLSLVIVSVKIIYKYIRKHVRRASVNEVKCSAMIFSRTFHAIQDTKANKVCVLINEAFVGVIRRESELSSD